MYYRGAFDRDTYDTLLKCCPVEPYKKGGEQLPCDFTQYLIIDHQGNANPNLKGNETWDNCANLITKWGFEQVWTSL
jgi:hypothetical protein